MTFMKSLLTFSKISHSQPQIFTIF